ncbi:MAG: hypothetical protein HQL64_01050 [Magnetococcales bacterium]|nr:hypothetical protein [Magnetococcales bacterium]
MAHMSSRTTREYDGHAPSDTLFWSDTNKMGSCAYIHLTTQADQSATRASDKLTWVGPEGHTRTEEAKQVATATARMRIVAVAPGVDVLIHALPVPKTSRRNLVKAIPFLLEEKVASPLEKLHFSLGPPLDNDERPVAVTDIDLMEQWLAQLGDIGIRPDSMVSETLLLPWTPASWTLLQTPEKALIRTGRYTGLAMDTAHARFLLDRLLAETDQTAQPEKLLVLNYTAEPFNTLFPDHPQLIVEETRPDMDPAALMARSTLESTNFNLLQGRFGIQGRWEGILRPFRLTAALALLWILVKLGVVFVDNQRMEAQLQAQETRIQEIFQQAFPGTRVVKPEAQMQERLKRLRQDAGGGQEFLNLLIQVGPPVLATPGTIMERIRYQDGLLDFYLYTKDLEQLNKLKQTIETSGRMEVTIRSAVKHDDSVESHLQIKGL